MIEEIDFNDFEWEEYQEEYKLILMGEGISSDIYILQQEISDNEIVLYNGYFYKSLKKNFWRKLLKKNFERYIKTNYILIHIHTSKGHRISKIWDKLPLEIREKIKI